MRRRARMLPKHHNKSVQRNGNTAKRHYSSLAPEDCFCFCVVERAMHSLSLIAEFTRRNRAMTRPTVPKCPVDAKPRRRQGQAHRSQKTTRGTMLKKKMKKNKKKKRRSKEEGGGDRGAAEAMRSRVSGGTVTGTVARAGSTPCFSTAMPWVFHSLVLLCNAMTGRQARRRCDVPHRAALVTSP